jgi:hypothetical protein
MALCTGFLGDELTNYSQTTFLIQYYIDGMAAINSPGPWQNAYNYIFQANAIINGLQNNTAISPTINQQLTGESKFIRAFWNFYLTNLYGNIPLVTGTNYAVNDVLSRSTRSQVYQQIIADIKDAQNLLNSNYVDATDTTVTTDRGRPTTWAATALLARVYLYTASYDSAEAQATAVINNTGLYSLCQDLNNVFLANSTEAIWQLDIPLPSSINTPDGLNFILTSAPSTAAGAVGNSATISPQLLSAFDSGDNRETSWISVFTSSTIPVTNYYFPYKYKVAESSNITEYVMVLRLAEQYLIRAEANAQLGNTSGAISDLNIIRNRAGLGYYAGGSDQASILNAILHENQVEMFTEWGHRWFDLIRTGNASAVMGSPGNVCQAKGASWNPNSELFPIPENEIKLDPNLTQNNGY